MSWTCNTCGCNPCVNPSFCKLCRAIDQRLASQRERVKVSLPALVPQSSLDAETYRRQQQQRDRRHD